ncbi:MAG: hypothetical protein IPM13_01610 [Phycisphaerales bacterium]|nr:hypothetical protein [Phycisphaerales bacterium]
MSVACRVSHVTSFICAGWVLWSVGVAGAAPVEWPTSAGGNGHFYEVVVNPDLGWDAAQALAVASGGYLATITSEEEQQFIEDLLLDALTLTGGIWIGLWEPSEGDWQWITGEPLSFDNWAPDQPDNALGVENRGQLLWTLGGEEPTAYRRGWWNDAPESGWASNPFDPALLDLNRRGWVVEYVPEPAVGAIALAIGAALVGRRRV